MKVSRYKLLWQKHNPAFHRTAEAAGDCDRWLQRIMIEDFQKALSNWIAQATEPEGKLPEGVSPSAWVAKHVVEWWRERIEDDVEAIETAAYAIREELEGLGGSKNKELGEAMHELVHLDDYLADLRRNLGIEEASSEEDSQPFMGPDA